MAEFGERLDELVALANHDGSRPWLPVWAEATKAAVSGEPVMMLPPVEWQAIGDLERTVRELDAMFDAQNDGPGPRNEWRLDGRRVTADASYVLLRIHDCLGDLTRAREHPGEQAEILELRRGYAPGLEVGDVGTGD